MIKKLFSLSCFNYEKFIIDNVSSFSLNINDAFILIRIINLYKESNVFDGEKIRENINIRTDEFEASLINLQEKNYYTIYLEEENGIAHELFHIDGFFSKCESIININYEKKDDSLNDIIELISNSFNRILTANEIEIVKSLVIDDLYKLDDFKLALNELSNKNVRNIKSLSLALNRKRDKKKKNEEAPQAFKDFLNKIK